MEFILENYILFIIIGLFIVFALIGYIIDTIRRGNVNNNIKNNESNFENNNEMTLPKKNENISSSTLDELITEYNNNDNIQ